VSSLERRVSYRGFFESTVIQEDILPVTSGGSTLKSLKGKGREETEGLESPLLLEDKDADSK
jgi:hypothetical protein